VSFANDHALKAVPVWALAGSLLAHVLMFVAFPSRGQSSLQNATPAIMAALIVPARRSGSATEQSSMEKSVGAHARGHVAAPAPAVARKRTPRRVVGRQSPLETAHPPEPVSTRVPFLPSLAPPPVGESSSGRDGMHSGGPDSATAGLTAGNRAAGPGTALGSGGRALTPARFDAGYLNNPSPPYPSRSRRLGEEGKVIVRVRVSSEGHAEDVEIKASSGSTRLDESALQTVRRWQFIPARRGNDAVASWVLVPVLFRLEQ